MPKAVYDTRFFVKYFYSKDKRTLQKTRTDRNRRERYVSTNALHEIYRLVLMLEELETAKLRKATIEQEFKTIPVDSKIAETSAELRHKYNLSMADSMIAATTATLGAQCTSDDPHFLSIKEIKTKWIQ
jgi:predicted nucleic acid-binding protein